MIQSLFRSLVAVMSIGVTACTTPVTPDFAGMSSSYAQILEQYQINSILMNIVRASDLRPLSFLDMPNINGSGSVSNGASLGGSLTGFGGAPISTITSISPSYTLSVGNGFNFTQSSLDNSTFWRSFLTPVTVDTMQFFIKNHIPSEVVFSLMVEQITITRPDGSERVFINNPLLPTYPEFQKELYRLLGYGLTLDLVDPNKKPAAPKSSYPVNSMYGGMYGGVEGAGDGTGMYGYGSQPVQQKPLYRFCMRANKFSNYVRDEFDPGVFCKSSSQSPIHPKGNKSQLSIDVRSVRTMFDFLGLVLTAQHQSTPYMVTLPPSSEYNFSRKSGEKNQFALLVINKNNSTDRPFAMVQSLGKNTYSIPEIGSGYSTLVVDMLSQLLTLSKIPGSIPISPSVLVR